MKGFEINFGQNSTWTAPNDPRFASITRCGPVVEDWDAAVNRALSSPVDFPSLDQALVPGDQFVLAVDPAIPSLLEVVSATILWFSQRGVSPSNIRVVLASDGSWVSEELSAAIGQHCGSEIATEIAVEQHSCDNVEQLAYVAANEDSDPIYLNRSLVDADVVIPITASRPHDCVDYFGSFGIFPLFSDRNTRGKFYSLPSLEDRQKRDSLQAWADQAAWWVGLMVGIQVIPACGDRAIAIMSGQLESLEAATERAWRPQWGEPALGSDIVIAVNDGRPQSQSWLSVARSLAAAQKRVTPAGAIVLVTQLSHPVGSGLSKLRNSHLSPESIAKKLAQDASDDALAAAIVQQVTANHHVYLISPLRRDTVESLGMGAISDATQLNRLLDQFSSCTILEAIQHH